MPASNRRIGQHEVKVDHRRQLHVTNSDIIDTRTRGSESIDGFVEPRPHLIVQQVEEVSAWNREVKTAHGPGRW